MAWMGSRISNLPLFSQISNRRTSKALGAACRIEPLEERQLLSLMIELRLPGTDSHTVPVTQVGQVVNVEVWAVVSGTDNTGANDGLSLVNGSFLSTDQPDNGSARGTLAASPTDPFTAEGSYNGTQIDLDGDGDLDVGSSHPANVDGYYDASGNYSPDGGDGLHQETFWGARYGGAGGQYMVYGAEATPTEFKIGDLSFTVTELLPGTHTEINYRPRKYAQFGATWIEDDDGATTQALNPRKGTYIAGDPIVLTRVTQPPQLTVPGNAVVGIGAPFQAQASFTAASLSQCTVSVDYGDNTPLEQPVPDDAGVFTLAHTYAAEGLYTVTVTVTDSAGSAAGTLDVTARGPSLKGTAGDDSFALALDPSGAMVEFYENAAAQQPTFTIPLALAGNIAINGNGGRDTLAIRSGSFDLAPDAQTGSAAFDLNIGGDGTVTLRNAPTLGSLTIGSTARLNLAGYSSPLHLADLAITDEGTLDIADTDLILQPKPERKADLMAALNLWLRSGRHGSDWKGTGIASSLAVADTLKGVAVLDNDRGNGTPWLGTFAHEDVSAADILLKVTWAGDADLNGTVDADDYFRIDRGLAAGKTAYHDGDFSYDGQVNGDDYQLIDAAYFGRTATPQSASAAVAAPARFSKSRITRKLASPARHHPKKTPAKPAHRQTPPAFSNPAIN